MTAKVPQWAVDDITKWKAILLLHEWETRTTLSPNPDDDETGQTRAVVSLHPDNMLAIITLREDIPPKLDMVPPLEREEWRRTIIHELVHVRMARLTCFVEEELLTGLSVADNVRLSRLLRHEVEPLVELLTSILYDLDNRPEGQP